jgi:hypothetical protein
MNTSIKIRRKGAPKAVNQSAPTTPTAVAAPPQFPPPPPVAQAPQAPENSESVDLERRRSQLTAKVAELQWDLGGLVYEMATRNRMRPDVLVRRAAALQEADAELGEIERILRMERTGVAALCLTCGAPHSAGAVYCWQCGGSLLEKVPGTTIGAVPPRAESA